MPAVPPPRSSDRGVALLKFVLGLLATKPEGMRPQDIYREIEANISLDEFDKEIMKGSGLPRWRAVLHFQSVAASKAGLLVKSDGRWHATEEGEAKSALSPDELKKLIRARYRDWRWGARPKAQREAEEPVPPIDELPTPATSSVLFEDAKERARAEIDAHLDRLDGYEFQALVAALLEAMGYTARHVAAPGPDGGTDILAYIDPIGAQTPHIRVQVKHRDNAATREEIAALRGIIRGDREIGLFVSSGGFTKDARREAGNGSVHIDLVDLDRFLELWLQHYDKIPQTAKAKLRLEPVYFLAPEIG
jgi:restriction system protein